MKTLTEQLAGYAAYHRDGRNIATHLVGVPVIVFAVVVLLSRPTLGALGGAPVTPALIGPLFVAAEVLFLLGLRRTLREAIEARVGPTRSGRPGSAAA
jgi:uncharacterized membrane protein YGL010W